MVQIAAGNTLDLRVCDDVGYGLIHYAVVKSNFNAVKAFLEMDPNCLTTIHKKISVWFKILTYLSKNKQDTLMAAVTHSNMPMLRLCLQHFPDYSFRSSDDWGFTPLTYCIKNNFLTGWLYLLAKGAHLTSEIVDINKCTFAHWACHADRRFILGILFRADLNFRLLDNVGMTPWDRAVDNWSLGCMNFLMDYSQRPLKTMYFLKRQISLPEYDLLPELPKVRAYEIESSYFKEKLLDQKRLRMGMYNSIFSVLKFGCGLYLNRFVRVYWDRNNIKLGLATKTYFLLISAILAHSIWGLQILTFVPIVGWITCLLAFFALYSGMSFGKSTPIATAIEKSAALSNKKAAVQFDEYYVPQEDYDRYLNSFGLTNSIYERTATMVDEEDWEGLQQVQVEQMCSICGIYKPQKTRHCPNVNLCVRDYQMYSYFWDQPVFSANDFAYFKWLTFDLIFLLAYLFQFYLLLGTQVLDQGILMVWFNLNFKLWTSSHYLLLALHLLLSHALVVKTFNLVVFSYCIAKNLTLDEIYNPHYYPYLFRKKPKGRTVSKYDDPERSALHWLLFNPNDQGWQENVSGFVKRGWQGPIYTS